MPNVQVACWTMSEVPLTGVNTGGRITNLLNIALQADTRLKIDGRVAGGAFTRMLIVPEYYFNAGGALLGRSNKHAIYRQLENISAQVPELLIIAGSIAYEKGFFSTDTYNVCPVLLGGTIIKKLYKANDDGVYQNNGTFRTKTDNGKGTPLFNIGGLSIGMDICMDINDHRLENYIANNHLARPDIHIQISGSNSTRSNSAQARIGGVYIHCDLGGKGATGATAWRVNSFSDTGDAATTRIQPSDTLLPGTGRVMLFDASC
jgi:hypothetical protein